MNKKILLLGIALFLAGHFLSAAEVWTITVRADGTKTTYALNNAQQIVFEDEAIKLKLKSEDVVSGTNISFTTAMATGLKMLQKEASVWVFPNPVQTNLTVSGLDKDAKIKLFDINGTFLQSIQALENSVNIDVSALPQGLYLLQIGKQMVKFIKQ